jgi:hypothetical protein
VDKTVQKYVDDGSSSQDSDSDTDDDISTDCPTPQLFRRVSTSTESSPEGQDSMEVGEACIFGITGSDTRIQTISMNGPENVLQNTSKDSSKGPQTCAHGIFNPQGSVTVVGA